MTEIDSKFRSGNLPKGLQITPSRFLVLNKSYPNATITIDNLTWTTFAVYVKTPSWINCQKKFMVEAKSVAEIEIFSSVDKKNTQNTLNDKIKITFIDMSNKDTIYNARLLVEYTNYQGHHHLSDKEYEVSRSVFLLQASTFLLLMSLLLLAFHYRFQVQYYLCVFKSTLCQLSKAEETPWFRKFFRC